MNQKIGKAIYYKIPFLKPILKYLFNHYVMKPRFSGWGMSTFHEPPWILDNEDKEFLEIAENVKNFLLARNINGIVTIPII